MSEVQEPLSLANCDREPIHQLGKIQDFGALVAVNSDWFIAHRSANLESMLGLDKTVEIGARLSSIIGTNAETRIRSSASILGDKDHVERLFGIDLAGNGNLFDCAVHTSGAFTIIEIEPHTAGDLERQIAMLRPIMARLDKFDRPETLAGEAARQLRMVLGIDRVMVYRFRDDLSGEVIAEAKSDDIEAFYGLRYPKSDIPAQARALYVRNRFRIISDVEAEPVPILPEFSLEGEPLDLSMSTLRAVSPIHIEYLHNMGVGASLSISIIIDGKLWGLFACHHYGPKLLPYSQRTAAELFSELFSLVMERVLAREMSHLQDEGRAVHDRLMRDIAAGTPLTKSLPMIDPIIERIIPHDGASVFVDDIYDSRGAAPSEEEFRAIAPILNAAATSRLLATEELVERIPRAASFADRAVGALVIPISRSPRDYLVLWRKPLKQVVNWAGNPEKPIEYGPNGARLTPRKSFEAWQETVEGRAEPWTPAEQKIAEGLRVTLLEIILRLTDEAVQERAKAQQQQELLIAELNHRVRNILNLIRGLVNQSKAEARDIEAFVDIISGRIGSLAMAHDNITKGNWSSAPLKDLIDSEAKAYLSGQLTERVVVTGPDVEVSPEAYTVLALVLHEMITNSAKYGALSDNSGTVTVAIERDAESDLRISWRETGGPPVKPPKRRGFGSTIIERSIPFELNGKSSVDYKLAGIEAEFCIPARFVEWKSSNTTGKSEARQKAVNPEIGTIPETVLLVEDSMIIALDTEDCLRELGVGDVPVASSVAGALSILSKSAPDIAILDYNLGQENSEEVAAELSRRGIPFWLATGYGEMRDRLDEIGASGLLVKPYGRDELVSILASFKPDEAVDA
ncbi:HWE histidine kinase domain-containing protein [Qipengyuania soli]|uniref:histidine kinase n=1 Tax=Qipengyuania soli TaxID=2782568 RepID=A0A7S8F3D8_9SPHN|nr:HWE histidine kinase domain-containing protein [Qipengyuania soli]QPC98278.1 GAF domain-containing protein [Qipengyuania soli]